MGAVEDRSVISPVRRRRTDSFKVLPTVEEPGGIGWAHVNRGNGALERSCIRGAGPPPGGDAGRRGREEDAGFEGPA